MRLETTKQIFEVAVKDPDFSLVDAKNLIGCLLQSKPSRKFHEPKPHYVEEIDGFDTVPKKRGRGRPKKRTEHQEEMLKHARESDKENRLSEVEEY